MALKSIVRSITIAIEDDETRKVKGFVQADIVANKAMIHSLIGNKVLFELTKENIKEICDQFNVDGISFVMEPNTVALFKKYWPDLHVGASTYISDKLVNWVTINI